MATCLVERYRSALLGECHGGHQFADYVELGFWALGVRPQDRPEGVVRHLVEAGATADGRTVDELDIGEDTWVSLVVRGHLDPVSGSTRLRADDEVLLTGNDRECCAGLFTAQ